MSFCKPGRLIRDVEVRQTQSGMSVASIGIAVDHGFGDNKGTMFINCSLWGKQAEGGLIKFLRKGRLIYVEGELGEKEYNGKKSMTLNISHIDPLFNKNESIDNEVNGGGQQQNNNNQQQGNSYQNNQQSNQQNQGFNNQQNQAPKNTAMAGGGMGPIDDDIPFNRFYDGQL